MPEKTFTPLRKIVMCFDGTGNEISKPHTNVYRIFQAAEAPGVLRFYHPGVGTLVGTDKLYKNIKFSKWLQDSMSGTSIRLAFSEAYQFLIDNAKDGDEIYFFGFSRGSYAARMFAAAVKMFGIPKPEHACIVPFIWQAYINTALRPGKDENVFEYAARIKHDFSRKVNIQMKFMGVFDTVSSFGRITAFKSMPYTRHNESVHVVRHAVSVDEHRSVFSINRVETVNTKQDVQQVWFAGCHSDVGGGHNIEESGLGMVSYQWMVDEARTHGLEINADLLAKQLEVCPPDHMAKLHESMDPMYGVIELLPIRKFNFDKKGLSFSWPNWFRRRTIDPEDTIHQSVIDRMRDDPTYRPKNVKQ